MTLLRRVTVDAIAGARFEPIDDQTTAQAASILRDVQTGGADALRAHAERLDDLSPGAPLVVPSDRLEGAFASLADDAKALLARTADRIRAFAEAQRRALAEIVVGVPGGIAGHRVAPVARAGCYAPGGRFALPSSVLMTAVTAKAAGVPEVWVASPRPSPMTLGAAHLAGADALVPVGGAQAIAAFAYGAGGVPRCDIIVGPGNRWVTAAKKLVFGEVAVDMLAGPSELVVLADDSARPDIVAADLLAQAEHDPDALPVLVTTAPALADAVEEALERQLADLPTASTARAALARGMAVLVPDIDAAIRACDVLAPEHLELQVADPAPVASRLRHYGALFVGAAAAEVLGDYGAGPNHVLPTSGTCRFTGGLSVLTFLRVRTFLDIDDPAAAAALSSDAAALARHEGLEAHARAAEIRQTIAARTDEWPITYADVVAAEARIRPFVPPTPLRGYAPLDEAVGNGLRVLVKHENHNPTNAFKARNGMSLVSALDEDARRRGVVAATRGNHGQAVAWAGQRLGVPVTICVPRGNNPDKNDAMRAYGATLIEEGADYDESVAAAERLVAERGLVMAHSTNDPRVIAGAGTLTLEIVEAAPELDAVVVSVGGGSQAVGAMTVLKARAPHVKVYGVQAENASAIHDSWHAGRPLTRSSADTFADGLATRTPYALTFDALLSGLAGFVTVSEAQIAAAVRTYLRTTHNLAEGAGAAALAGLSKLAPELAGQRVAVVLSGGNIDAATLARVVNEEL